MSKHVIVPGNTKKLIQALSDVDYSALSTPKRGDTRTYVDMFGVLGHKFDQHTQRGKLLQELANSFDYYSPPTSGPPAVSGGFGAVAAKPMDFKQGFFKATVLLAVHPELITSLKNESNDNVATVGYSKTVGVSNSDEVSVGVSVSMEQSIDSGFHSATMAMGFDISASSSHTISAETETNASVTCDPGESVYIYQLVYQWAVIHGRVQKYPDGNYVSIMTQEEVFRDKSSYITIRNQPI